MAENIVIPGYGRVIVPNTFWIKPAGMGKQPEFLLITRTGPVSVDSVVNLIIGTADTAMLTIYNDHKLIVISSEVLRRAINSYSERSF